MKEWSPQDAMKAYLDTLHLVSSSLPTAWNPTAKSPVEEDDKQGLIEPNCMELISAMAAGKGAKHIVEITTQGITPLTIALAVAAKHTGGQLTCILPSHHHHHHHTADQLQQYINLVHAEPTNTSPRETIIKQIKMRLKNVDFAVIDCKFDEEYLKLMFKTMVEEEDGIKTGSTVIVHNVHHKKDGSIFGQLLRKKRVEAVTLPIGEGTEMTRILGCRFKRRNRFLVTFHN
ncbi:hypothetical protein Gotur_006380 [Gossypium turneri]